MGANGSNLPLMNLPQIFRYSYTLLFTTLEAFRKRITGPVLCISSALFLLFLSPGWVFAAAICHHDLSVEIHPDRHLLLAQDSIQIESPQKGDLSFLLAKQVRLASVLVNGAATEYSFDAGRLTIPDTSHKQGIASVMIRYEAVFNDPIQEEPASFDNPGFGVTASITEKGSFLLPGAGWYPHAVNLRQDFRIRVEAPKGIYAVTAGELNGHEDKDDKSISSWTIRDIGQAPALSAGNYIVRSRMAGKVAILTYFSPENDSLSQTYLDAAASQIQFYESLHGPYPFSKFAVVENFFPTGYGFPSYTLLGKTVIRLPFIPATSLRHEIAHSWWGNGVLVDYESGNWCEGLTTYVADYLSREMDSPREGKLYRQQILQEYASLAASGEDFPLTGFTSRTSPSSRAVGYGKAAFIFHMIRKRLGDEPFWKSLRALFKEKLFTRTSWEDIRDTFVSKGGWDSQEARFFFDQWISRAGAPVLGLQDIHAREDPTGWMVTGSLLQNPPHYSLDVPLFLKTSQDADVNSKIAIRGSQSPFSLQSPLPPVQLSADPDFDLFRLLYPDEVPAVVNSVKGSKRLTAVLSASSAPKDAKIFAFLLASLNHADTPILQEKDVSMEENATADFLFFGVPRSSGLKSLLLSAPAEVIISSEKLSMKGDSASDCLFIAFRDPSRRAVTAIFAPAPGAPEDTVQAAARKITHYGKYGYLGFANGVIQVKGNWDITRSPLVFDFGSGRK